MAAEAKRPLKANRINGVQPRFKASWTATKEIPQIKAEVNKAVFPAVLFACFAIMDLLYVRFSQFSSRLDQRKRLKRFLV
jgi:hypothetical protein